MFPNFGFIQTAAGIAMIPTQPLLVTQGTAWVIVVAALIVACGTLWLIARGMNVPLHPRAPSRKTKRPPSRQRPLWPVASAHRS